MNETQSPPSEGDVYTSQLGNTFTLIVAEPDARGLYVWRHDQTGHYHLGGMYLS